MAREIVTCKVDGLTKNRITACPDYTCDNCPKIKANTKEPTTPKTKVFQFYPKERKIFAKGSLDLAIRIHDFLKDFIDKHNEDTIRGFYWQYEDFNRYLNTIEFLKAERSCWIEKIHELSCLIAKHSKQKKNIPLDCLLLGAVSFPEFQQIERVKQKLAEIPFSHKEFQAHALRKISKGLYARCDFKKLAEATGIKSKDAITKRIYWAQTTKYIQEIFNLAFDLIAF